MEQCLENIPAENIIISGSSAGGCLAAVASHQLVDGGLGHKLKGVALLNPNLVHHDAVPDVYKEHYNSYEEFKNGVILDQAGVTWFDGKCPAQLE
jgi:acetyl esterase/lipase